MPMELPSLDLSKDLSSLTGPIAPEDTLRLDGKAALSSGGLDGKAALSGGGE